MSKHRSKVVVEFFFDRLGSSSDRINGYIDTMNPKAVEAFIRVTYDAYAEKLLPLNRCQKGRSSLTPIKHQQTLKQRAMRQNLSSAHGFSVEKFFVGTILQRWCIQIWHGKDLTSKRKNQNKKLPKLNLLKACILTRLHSCTPARLHSCTLALLHLF